MPEPISISKPASGGFPIAGVGASAGGLEALMELVRHLPVDTGMAFVLVQHLDPQHESALTSLLSRVTRMPVCEVTPHQRVEPDHIYVIPPNVQMAISGGVLILTPRSKVRGATRSIDFFFESLAEDQRERAVGVVLSGTASDGTLGLEAIKAEGGLTFAQDESAKYDSMPRSAIVAGVVDFVLAPEAMAAELERIARHPFVVGGAPRTAPRKAKREVEAAAGVPVDNEGEFRRILLILRRHCGVDFTLYKSSTIQRRVMRRLVLNRQETLAAYAVFLKGNTRELDALYSDVLISVTSFFRNPEAFEALKRKVFPQLLAQQGREVPVRVWVLGCSTGQEAYSLAMAFAEAAGPDAPTAKLQIFATDLNEALLEKARSGLYAKSLAQDLTPGRLKRFFVEEDGGYRVSKLLREQVVFARHNVMSDPPFSRIDLITCRNLLIYLEPELQKKIFPAFHYALKRGGFLFLGASESIGQFTELFEPADKKQKIFSKLDAPTPAFRLPLPGGRGVPSAGNSRTVPLTSSGENLPEGRGGEFNAQREADRICVSQFAPPGVLVNAEGQVLQFRGATGAFLEPPTGRASFDILKMARDGLMLPLRTAFQQAKRDNKPVRGEAVRVRHESGTRAVTLQVIPLRNLKESCFLILFEDAENRTAGRTLPLQPPPPANKREAAGRIAELERELAETRDYLQSIQEQNETAHEEIQASNEEVQSANEELQSINEELETSKEELESSNEELTTINDEMLSRNTELNRLNADLINVQASMQTAILILARDLTIRRFTPNAEKVFNLLATDVGRGIGGIRHNLDAPDLELLLLEVVDTVSLREREIRDKDGRWFILRARPYFTLDNKVDGVVLVLSDIDELKRSEHEIKAARDYAEATLRTMPVPFLILSADLRVNSASDAFYRNFEVAPAETEGRLIYDLGNGQWDIPKLRTLLEEILPKESVFDGYEVTHTFESLGPRTMVLNARRFDSADGTPERIMLVIEDISARHLAEGALRKSEGRYRTLFDLGPVAVYSCDADGVIVDFNRTAVELWGRQPMRGDTDERFCGSFKMHLPDGTFLPHDQCPMAGVLTGQIPEARDMEVQMERPDGTRVTVIVNLRPLKNEVGEITGAISCFVDITARQQAEGKFRGLLESAPDAMVIINETGTIVLVNSRTEEVFGFPRSELLGNPIEMLMPQRFRQHHPGQRTNYFSRPRMRPMGDGLELFGVRKNGTEFPVEISLSPFETGEGILVSSTIRDITERKQGKQALQEAMAEIEAGSRAKDDFLAALSHELRTPLTPVLMMAASLENDPALTPEVRDQLSMMRRNIELEARLIDDLLDLTRITRGKLVIDRQPVDVHQLLDHTAEIVLSDRLGKEVRIVFDHQATRHHAFADSTRLQQVFWNLIKNAVKFTPPGGKITVTTRNDEAGRILISVADTGLGISGEALPHIFKAFEQGDVSGQHRYGGLGLGLAISQAIMEAHGGTILAESPGPGHGSTFTVGLAGKEAPAAPAPTPVIPAGRSRAMRLLVVEDHETTRNVLAQLLTNRGHHVTTAASIQEALAAFVAAHFDVVISDLGLPDGSGLDLMQQIQRLRPVPAIALSGYGMEADLQRTKEAGFFAHLVKPVNLDQLRQLIDQISPSRL